MEQFICRLCGDPKDADQFYTFVQKRGDKLIPTRRTECIECNKKNSHTYSQANPDYYLYQNMRGSDRRAGRICELTREDVKSLIQKSCEYCLGREERMSIDRKDNSIGHTQDNSVPCCLRCNALKRDMPYAAWLILVPAIRKARELGLFGTWIGHNSGSTILGSRRQLRTSSSKL